MNHFSDDLNCPHFPTCPGCVHQTQLDEIPLIQNAKKHYAAKGVVAPVLFRGAREWRTRAKLAVRGNSTNPKIGLFEAQSHNIVAIPQCQVHHPAINQAAEVIKSWIKQHQIDPYDEISHRGCLRYIQCTVERATGKIQLALVCSFEISPAALQELWDQTPLWHSIWVNLNTRKDNVIFGEKWSLKFGDEWLWEDLAGVKCCFHPAGFCQANLNAYEAVLKRIKGWVSPSDKAVEYYAGAGVIGLTLAADGVEVECFEASLSCENAFQESRKRLGKGSISWTCATTEKALQAMRGKNVIIVDPPRKGLDNKTIDALTRAEPGMSLIYLSCGWESCQRNLDALIGAGWKLQAAEIYLFFPGSDHIETLQLLER